MKKLIHRLKAIRLLMTSPHCAVVAISDNDIKRLFSDNEFEVDMYLVGLREYPFLKIVEQIHNNHSNTEMILKEIAFKAEAEGIK